MHDFIAFPLDFDSLCWLKYQIINLNLFQYLSDDLFRIPLVLHYTKQFELTYILNNNSYIRSLQAINLSVFKYEIFTRLSIIKFFSFSFYILFYANAVSFHLFSSFYFVFARAHRKMKCAALQHIHTHQQNWTE